MGQTNSKPLNSKVYEAPEIKIDPTLRKELESSPETDVVRRLYSEKYIEDKVAERLYEEQIAAKETVKERSELIPPLSEDRLGESNSLEMRKKVADLHKELTGRPLRGSLDEEGKLAREKLVECLKENKEKPLSCRRAFAELQQEISRIEKKFASQ